MKETKIIKELGNREIAECVEEIYNRIIIDDMHHIEYIMRLILLRRLGIKLGDKIAIRSANKQGLLAYGILGKITLTKAIKELPLDNNYKGKVEPETFNTGAITFSIFTDTPYKDGTCVTNVTVLSFDDNVNKGVNIILYEND